MPWTIASQPVLDSAALEALKDQVRELSNAFDAELQRILNETVVALQERTNRQFINATAVHTRERFPSGSTKLFLPPSPLVSVTSVQYADTSDSLKTWAATNYEVTKNEEPGFLRPKFTAAAGYGTYPTDARARADVVVTYVVGFGTTWNAIRKDIQRAILLKAHQTYRPGELDAMFVEAAIQSVMVGDDLCVEV